MQRFCTSGLNRLPCAQLDALDPVAGCPAVWLDRIRGKVGQVMADPCARDFHHRHCFERDIRQLITEQLRHAHAVALTDQLLGTGQQMLTICGGRSRG